MTTVAIIGVGLIGGSLGMALIETKKYKVIGIGRNYERLKLAQKLNAVNEFTTEIKEGIKNVDIIVISTPVDTIVPFYKKIREYTNDTIITDVGSVKSNIFTIAQETKDRNIVPAHPLAGSEKSGVAASKHEMFINSTIVLTPTEYTSKYAIDKVRQMWKDVGAKVIVMSAEKHDFLVAHTSHLPHAISASFVNLIGSLSRNDKRVKNLLAGSFKDMTRITDSPPDSWAKICSMNKKNLKIAIDEFIKELKLFRDNLSDEKSLFKYFLKGKKIREKWIRK